MKKLPESADYKISLKERYEQSLNQKSRTENKLHVIAVGYDPFEPKMIFVALSERPTNDEIEIINNILRQHFP